MKTQIIQWAVGLSDGTNAQEGKGDYITQEGTLSPWQRLIQHIEKNGLTITSLSLYSEERRWILPSAGNNPKSPIFRETEKPINFKFRRRIQGVVGGKIEKYAYIEAEYLDKKLQIWVDEDGKSSWSLII